MDSNGGAFRQTWKTLLFWELTTSAYFHLETPFKVLTSHKTLDYNILKPYVDVIHGLWDMAI